MAASASSLHISLRIPLSSPSISPQISTLTNISSIRFSERNKLWNIRSRQNFVGRITSESKDQPAETGLTPKVSNSLQIGSPIIIVEAPKMLKTAASVPCLRVNSGLVNAGDVGRIMSRKPKDVWAVRLTIGTYLIDGKYFKPLQLEGYLYNWVGSTYIKHNQLYATQAPIWVISKEFIDPPFSPN